VNVSDIRDADTLRQAVSILDGENRKLIHEVLELRRRVRELEGKEPVQLAMDVSELEHQLRIRNRMLFGNKSETRHQGNGKKKKDDDSQLQTGHGPREQPNIPLVEVEHRLDEADQVCSSCGGKLEPWKGQSEDSEDIESIERCFIRVKHRRQKYRCRCGGCVETAPAPKKIIPGGRYASSVAIAVAVDKYCDHLPLERQAKIMTRQGLAIDSQTLWDQIEALARLLAPVYERLHDYVLSKPVLGGDETPWKLLGNQGRASKRWYAWALCAEDAVVYRIDESRSAEAAKKVLRDFRGTLLCDGYTAYEALRKQEGAFRIAHCWAHVRRKFIEAEESAPKQCGEVLDLIGQLYEVERIARDGPPEQRLAIRREKGKPIMLQIQQWVLASRTLPQSALGKAVGYLSSLWAGLQVYLDDPHVAPDNNAVERALRAVVVGRKNHYGSKSLRGTEVAALFYSLIESARMVGLHPDKYLRAATQAALDGEAIPMPHEVAASAASA
jgi:transposase